MTTRLVVIGNGMAGMRCVEEIIRLAPDRYDITVFGSEPRPNYNRILLSQVLHGKSSFDDIVLHSLDWYAQHGITLYTGEMVTHIDPQLRILHTQHGRSTAYDVLIIATGSAPFIPPLPGSDKKGVIAFRSLDDCEVMMEYAKQYKQAAVIGGGLLGLEAARGLLHLGMDVRVVHNAPYLMNRQLDELAAGLLRRELEQQGMQFELGRKTVRITGSHRAQGLRFDNGDRLAADLIVMAVGIRPRIGLARQCGLAVNRAIIVNDVMETSIPGIYAVGECAEHRGISYGLVAPLYEQAKTLAAHLCHEPHVAYTGSLPYSQLKISGVHVFSIGDIQNHNAQTLVQQYDGVACTYRKIIATDGILSGAILYGDTSEGTSLVDMVRQGMSVEQWMQSNAMPNTQTDHTYTPAENAAIALATHAIVCACNDVSKQTILYAIWDHDLETVDEVQQATRASSSCGGCRPTVEALTRCHAACQQTLHNGTDASTEHKQTPLLTPASIAVCSCTSRSHEQLRYEIFTAMDEQHHTQQLPPWSKQSYSSEQTLSHQQLRHQLDWQSIDGCDICQPAIAYYMKADQLQHQLRNRANGNSTTLIECVDTASRQHPHHRDGCEDHNGEHKRATATSTVTNAAQSPFTISSPLIQWHLSLDDDEAMQKIQQYARQWHHLPFPHSLQMAAGEMGAWHAPQILFADLGVSPSPAGWELYGGGSLLPLRAAQLIVEHESLNAVLSMLTTCLEQYICTAYYGEPVAHWLERQGLMSLREQLLHHHYRWQEQPSQKGEESHEYPVSILQRTM